MTTIDNDNKPNRDDKDYGFPFVEVTPLLPTVNQDNNVNDESENERVIASELASPVYPDNPKPSISSTKIKSDKNSLHKKKSQLPLLLSLVFLIIIILGSIAYFLYYVPESDTNVATNDQIVSQELFEEDLLEDPVEDVEAGQEEIEDLDNLNESESETTEVATAQEVFAAEIIVVDKRGQFPYYNVIIASSPNERIARIEAQKIVDKGRTAWIIFPFGNTNNYRISVGRYEDLESATKAMEEARVELNESSWILKY